METTIDEAVAVIVAEAEAHERENDAEFCAGVRVSLVVFVMGHLGLGLGDLGLIAEGIAMMDAAADEGGSDDVLDAKEVSG